MSEYALILVLVAIAVIVALTAVGKQLSSVFDKIKTALSVG
ncbi:MAG: Flp family type IVb pilin [Candidatus Dormibacteraeota bacterium]|nr:Flp family type IVb pilin [Candidatus Dormibacteraeota bacterium]